MFPTRTAATLFAAAAFTTVVIIGCGEDRTASGMTGTVQIDGSSTVFPITGAVAEDFEKAHKGIRVTVGVSGTGGGFKRFTKGETDISNASRPIKQKELDAAAAANVDFIEVPVAYDGLSIVVNKQNDWCKSLTVDQLKGIFLEDRAAMSWKDVDPSYPDLKIRIYAPGTDSGTFDYFKEVVAGSTGSIRHDMSVSENDNELVTGVAGEKGALGFFGYAYYVANKDKLRVLAIDGGDGAVLPDEATIENGTYAPFSRPLFIYIRAKSLDKPEVAAFVDYYLEHGGDRAADEGYVRLPKAVYATARKNVEARKLGTQFLKAGEALSGPLPQLYR